MKLILKKNPTITLLIIGDGNDKRRLKNLTKKLNLTKNIKFTGEVHYSEIPNYCKKMIKMRKD